MKLARRVDGWNYLEVPVCSFEEMASLESAVIVSIA
jgi:hypothetical protein